MWQAQDSRDGAPEWTDAQVAERVGEELRPAGLYTSVRVTVTEEAGESRLR